MKIKVQNLNDAYVCNSGMSLKEAVKGNLGFLCKEGDDIFEIAIAVMERFPRIKEITFSSELTEIDDGIVRGDCRQCTDW